MTTWIQDQLFARAPLHSIIQGILAPQPRDFSLIGAKFMGKTSILNHLAAPEGPLLNDHPSKGPHPEDELAVVYYDCAWPDAQADLLAFLVDRLLHHLQQQAMAPEIDLERIRQEADAGARLRRLIAELKRNGYRPVLLLDNFDTLITNAGAEMERRINQLRPLTREIVLVVASELPLHEANRELASSPLFNLLNQVFLRLIEPEEVERLLRSATAGCDDQETLVAKLAEWTGGHPFLLSRIAEILLDVDEMLPAGQRVGAAHLPLIRLRLTEDYGRLLFGEVWADLQEQTDSRVANTLELLRRLLVEPLPLSQIGPEQARTFYWLLNKGIVRIEGETCHIFSPLFQEYLVARLEPINAANSARADVQDARMLIEERSQRFTPQERNLLRYFLDHPGEVVSVDQLLADVWKRPNASARRVQEGIRRLRNRLEALQMPVGQIENEWGQGYKFVPASGERGH